MKKFLSVLMAATMLVGVMALTGCGGSKEYPSQNISVICPYSAGGIPRRGKQPERTRLHHRHRPEDRHRGRAHHVHQRGLPAL